MLEDLQARRDGFVVLVKLAFFRGSALSFPTESTVVIKRIVLVPGGVALIVLMTIVVVDCRTLVPVNEAAQPLWSVSACGSGNDGAAEAYLACCRTGPVCLRSDILADDLGLYRKPRQIL
jgi:hypothetical protein